MDITQKLMEKLEDAEGSYRDDLIQKIVQICSQANYQHITDFEWYINVLIELTHVGTTGHGALLCDQLMDVCIRVQLIRECGVSNMVCYRPTDRPILNQIRMQLTYLFVCCMRAPVCRLPSCVIRN
jgi:hypothetical protein